jgi:hypothetical protein
VSNSKELPVACALTPETLATRKSGLLPGLARDASTVEPVANGLRLLLAPDAIPRIAETIDAERRCCRFLRFDLTIEPDEGPVRLTITGPSGTREFLEALIER